VGAKAGVTNSIEPGVTVLGQPAVPINDCKRQMAVAQRLPQMKDEVRHLRRDLDKLRKQIEGT
jgi:UDP-3-O-[3-hydroxymyristoyl] glucosamine N-acyltransferase